MTIHEVVIGLLLLCPWSVVGFILLRSVTAVRLVRPNRVHGQCRPGEPTLRK
jgi:hypothetical protein